MKLYWKRMCAYLIDLLIALILCNLFLFSYQVFRMDPEMKSFQKIRPVGVEIF